MVKKKKVIKKKKSKKRTQFIPIIFSRNHSIKPLKLNKAFVIGHPERYPLGRYPKPVAISHGSRSIACVRHMQRVKQNNGIVINHPNNIRNASSKTISKKLFLANNIPTTPFMAPVDMLSKGKFYSKRMTLNYPIVAKLDNGYGGTGMSLIKDREDLKAWYKINKLSIRDYFFEECFNWSEDIHTHLKTTREYRIGVAPSLEGRDCIYTWSTHDTDDEGSIVGDLKEFNFTSNVGAIVQLRKMMRTEAAKAGEFGRNLALGNSYFVRNFKTDYNYTNRNVVMDWNEGVKHCIEAVKALGLQYGAVDILWSSTTGKWNVIEVNTAPSMGSIDEGHSFTLGQWQQGFKYLIEAALEQ